MLLVHWARRAASRAAWTAGSSRAMSTPMMAITTKSSISVNPRRRRIIGVSPIEAAHTGTVLVAGGSIRTGHGAQTITEGGVAIRGTFPPARYGRLGGIWVAG